MSFGLPPVTCSLAGREVPVRGRGARADYLAALLASLGASISCDGGRRDPHPAVEWARSGAMALTGRPDGPPCLAPGPLAACARAATEAIGILAGASETGWPDGAALLAERAALLGLGRRGTTSPGGSCRLLPAADRWIAVNLARPDDLALLPAWLGEGGARDPWGFVAARVALRSAEEVVERGRLLGLPVAVAADPPASPPPWCRVVARGPRATRARRRHPLVVDLSALWAGPLCAHLLLLAGARVIKLESSRRLDGARRGPTAFFDLLNAGKRSVVLDLGTSSGRERLLRLLESADIVVESTRPRAMAQLGIDVESLVARGLTWVSITGYGRRGPEAGWVAFGDDAGAAAGLAVATGSGGETPLFCGDAIADPLAGIHAALAALASWSGGRGELLELSLCDVAAHALLSGPPPSAASAATVSRRGAGWEVRAGKERAAVRAPRARPPRGAARLPGADTAAVLAELGLPC